MKKIFYSFILLMLIIIPESIYAKNDDYEINDYTIEINVDKNYKYSYKENMDITFNKINVLITKELPYDTKDISVNNNFMIETKEDKIIKIYSRKNSHKQYDFSYNIKKGNRNKDIIEVDIKNSFNNDIKNLNFIVNLPQYFNKYNVDFYLNNEKVSDLSYDIKEKEIIGNIEELKEGDILTIKIDYAKLYISPLTFITIIVSLIFSLLSYLIWYLYGKDLKYKVEKNSNINQKLTPIDMSLILKGQIEDEDSLYLLLHLANKGYIKIKEEKNNEFYITREKDYDGNSYLEASFLRALFRKDMSVSISEYINVLTDKSKTPYKKELDKKISSDKIGYRLLRASKNIISIVNSNDDKSKYFETKSDNKKMYLLFFITTILVLITSTPFVEINKLYLLPISVLFSIITLFILINMVENIDLKRKDNRLSLLIIFAIIALIILLVPSFKRNRIYFIAFLIGLAAVTFIMLLYKYMPKRTPYGSKIIAKIEGYKKYLTELNSSEIDSVLKENENYLYDILAYSYILGIESNIYELLKEKDIKQPKWYVINDFTHRKLYNSINRLKHILKNESKEE